MYFSGKIVLDPALVPEAKDMRNLFVILYDDSVNKRMPFGAVRFNLQKDPESDVLTLSATPENIKRMFPGNAMPQNFRIKARLDRDGVAGPDQSGDLVGEITNIAYGSKNLEIQINRKVTF